MLLFKQGVASIKYEPNPKHKAPWQPGRKGTLCPPASELSLLEATRLLRDSDLVGNKRYNFYNGKAYCARPHGEDLWHGYPVDWSEVPHCVRKKWLEAGRIKRSDMRGSPS